MTANLFQDRFQQLMRFFEVRAADRALSRLLESRGQQAGQARSLQALPAPSDEDLVLLAQCVAKGAKAHLKPGLVDRLVRMPQLACALMAHGAVPTEGFMDQIDACLWGADIDLLRYRAKDPPVKPIDWLHKALFTALSKAPLLDWHRLRGEFETYTKSGMFDQRVDIAFHGFADAVVLARQQHGLPPGPMGETPDVYTAMLRSLFIPRDMIMSRLKVKWKPQDIAWVVPGLIAQGADPNACAKLGSYTQAPMLAHALLVEPSAVKPLLESGARVDERVLQTMIFAVCDKQFINERTYHDTIRAAFEMVMNHYETIVDWNLVVPSEDYYQPTFHRMVSEQFPELMPKLLEREAFKRARDELALLDMGTAGVEAAERRKRGPARL